MQVTTSNWPFGACPPVVDRCARFLLMQPGDREWCLRHVDAGHPGARLLHGLRQDPTAAADVDDGFAGEFDPLTDPVET